MQHFFSIGGKAHAYTRTRTNTNPNGTEAMLRAEVGMRVRCANKASAE
jgi:hypothetical protein